MVSLAATTTVALPYKNAIRLLALLSWCSWGYRARRYISSTIEINKHDNAHPQVGETPSRRAGCVVIAMRSTSPGDRGPDIYRERIYLIFRAIGS